MLNYKGVDQRRTLELLNIVILYSSTLASLAKRSISTPSRQVYRIVDGVCFESAGRSLYFPEMFMFMAMWVCPSNCVMADCRLSSHIEHAFIAIRSLSDSNLSIVRGNRPFPLSLRGYGT